MIGIDSNVLLRAITNDDLQQTPIARKFLASLTPAYPGVISSVVLAELTWTLRTNFNRKRDDVLNRINVLLKSNSYHFPDMVAANRALENCRRHKLEFGDALIGELDLAARAHTTMTFDAEASKTPVFTLLKL
ncbi:MAG: PIN domain-containing protein [Hyphomicrobiales bacterium]|nr:PIN domain-containing protein [Hyphomicrobiales bacterium]